MAANREIVNYRLPPEWDKVLVSNQKQRSRIINAMSLISRIRDDSGIREKLLRKGWDLLLDNDDYSKPNNTIAQIHNLIRQAYSPFLPENPPTSEDITCAGAALRTCCQYWQGEETPPGKLIANILADKTGETLDEATRYVGLLSDFAVSDRVEDKIMEAFPHLNYKARIEYLSGLI